MHPDTKPLFIVGCGRSGSQALARLFGSVASIEMHHEYMVHQIQPLGVMHYHGLLKQEEVTQKLLEIYGAALHYSEAPMWGDSSNKASWFVTELAELFPEAKFIHLIRDGRKVTSSLFNKLGAECLDDRSVAILRDYLINPHVEHSCPPPEKKYWWPMAKESGDLTTYQLLDHFGRIAYHWAQINAVIERQFLDLSTDRFIQVRLEDITSSEVALSDMMRFAGVVPLAEHYALMEKPYNVVRPENNPLLQEQSSIFWKLCDAPMKKYGYAGTEEYILNYDPVPTAASKV